MDTKTRRVAKETRMHTNTKLPKARRHIYIQLAFLIHKLLHPFHALSVHSYSHKYISHRSLLPLKSSTYTHRHGSNILPTFPHIMSDSQALSILMKSPVTHDMVAHIVNCTLKVIQCKKSKVYPTPPSSPDGKATTKPLPSLMTFISRLVRYSNVYTGTLLCSLVYLERLSAKLPKRAQGLPCTLHRIFLATLIISSKFNNDSSPKNKHWTNYTDGLFHVEEVNLMERQLLQLMNWDVIVTEADLAHTLRRFIDPIKQDLKKAARIRRSISKQRLQVPSPTSPQQYGPQTSSPISYSSQMTTPISYNHSSPQYQYTQQHMRSQSACSISSMSSTSSESLDEEMSSHLTNPVQYQYQLPSQPPKSTASQVTKMGDDDVYLPSLWGSAMI